MTLTAVVKVLAPESTSVPMSPLESVEPLLVSRTPARVRVLPGITRISLLVLLERKLRVEVKVSVARKLPPSRVMTLDAAPRAPSFEAASTPALMLMVPVKSLAGLVSSNVPAPFFWMP